MTSYSVLKATSERASIIGTWPGFEAEEHSVKVTTVSTLSQAHHLASMLTKVSESAWDAAMWLDTYTPVEIAISELICQLRSPNVVHAQSISYTGLRHAESWTSTSLRDQLGDPYFASTLSGLSTAQRLSVAAELEADANERHDLLEPDRDEFDVDSRVNQAGLVTRVQAFGATGPLPDGAAHYLRTCYGEELDFGDRWAAAEQIRRMEQLVAACNHHGGHAHADTDPFEALGVAATSPAETDDGTRWYVTPVRYGPNAHSPNRPNPHGKLRVRRGWDWVAELDPDDDDGFVEVLGDWAATFTSQKPAKAI